MTPLSVTEAGARLRCSSSTVVRKIHSGELPAKRLGKSWLLDQRDVDAVASDRARDAD